MSVDLQTPLVNGDGPRKWNEMEIPEVRCSDSERKKIPALIRNPIMQVWYSFIYCFLGNYYLFTHGLWQYLVLESSFCVFCWYSVLCLIPITIVTVCSFFPPLFAIGGLYWTVPGLVMWLTDAIINFAFMRGMKRVSYVEEHKMKGSDYRFKFYSGVDSGEKFDLMKVCWNIFLTLCAFLFKKLCKDLIVFTLIAVFALIIVFTLGLGLFVCPFIIIYIMAMNFGFTSFSHGYLNRRYNSYFGILGWAARHHWAILGYGLGAMCVYLIPGLQVIHYFYGSIGATRFAVHFEDRMDEERDGGVVSHKSSSSNTNVLFEDDKDQEQDSIIRSEIEEEVDAHGERVEEVKHQTFVEV